MNALRDAVETEARDTRMPADTPTSAILHERWRILGLVVGHIVVGWMGAYFAYYARRGPTLYAAAFIGLMFSQTSLLGIWGSLGTSPWWKRVIGVVSGVSCLVPVLGIGINEVSIETFVVVILVTSFVAIPLLIVRFFRIAIRLDAFPVASAGRIQFSIRHLMILTIVVACLITIGKLGQQLLSQAEILHLLLIALTCGVVGILPVWFVLASNCPKSFSIGVVAVGACAGYCLGLRDMDEGLYWMTATATEALSVVVSLLLVRSWGYRLVRLPKKML